jgi:hypothetical protein
VPRVPPDSGRHAVSTIDPLNHEARPRAVRYGDAAGEHLTIERGVRAAWPFVILAFALEAALIAFAIYTLGELAGDHSKDPPLLTLGLALVIPFFVFRDRWRCIEAHTSRYRTGPLSLLSLTFVAFAYANLRAARKLAGR